MGTRADDARTIARVAFLAFGLAIIVNGLAIWTFVRVDCVDCANSLFPLAGLAIALDLAAITPVRDWWKTRRRSARKARSRISRPGQ